MDADPSMHRPMLPSPGREGLWTASGRICVHLRSSAANMILPYPRSSAFICGRRSHDLVQPEVMRTQLAAVIAGGDPQDPGDARSIDAGAHRPGDRVEVDA